MLYVIDVLNYTVVNNDWGIGIVNYRYCDKQFSLSYLMFQKFLFNERFQDSFANKALI